MHEIMRLLNQVRAGTTPAAELLPLVYSELRVLAAAAKRARENPDHTLDTTALVHEAYLRIDSGQDFDHRGHFFAAAAEAMRRSLVDDARKKRAEKHGGGLQRHGADETKAVPTSEWCAECKRRSECVGPLSRPRTTPSAVEDEALR